MSCCLLLLGLQAVVLLVAGLALAIFGTHFLVELMFWGMNAIGIWYAEYMPAPGDGPEGKRLERMYRKVVEIARSWRLRICLLMTANILPPFPETHPLEAHRSYSIPDGLWNKFECPGIYCPQPLELRRMMREYRDKLITLFRPDWIEIFPTDPGGCECEKCSPWWQTYLALAKEYLAPWVDRVPLRGINFWYFWNRDAAALAEHLGGDGIINTISTQNAWQESTRERMRISDRLTRQGYRIMLWPDITMNGGWGMYGTYPFPDELGSLFRDSRRMPYGLLPYTEGRYDDFNKFALLELAWTPTLDTAEVTRRVMTGMFAQEMPAEALQAIALLEKRQYAQADTLLTAVEAHLDAATCADWRWFSLRFHARHAPLSDAVSRLAAELDAAKKRAEAAPLTTRELKQLRRKLAAVEKRFSVYADELPALYYQVNGLRRRHQIGCGTTYPDRKKLRSNTGVAALALTFSALIGEHAEEQEKEVTAAVDFRSAE